MEIENGSSLKSLAENVQVSLQNLAIQPTEQNVFLLADCFLKLRSIRDGAEETEALQERIRVLETRQAELEKALKETNLRKWEEIRKGAPAEEAESDV